MPSERRPLPIPRTQAPPADEFDWQVVRECLRESSWLLRNGWWAYSGVTLLYLLGFFGWAVVFDALVASPRPHDPTPGALALFTLLLPAALVVLHTQSMFQLADGHLRTGRVALADALPSRLDPRLGLAIALQWTACALGLPLLIIGAALTGGAVTHASALLATRPIGLREAFGLSWAAFRADPWLHARWEFILLLFVVFSLAMPCGIGLIFFLPVVRIAQVVASETFFPETLDDSATLEVFA